MTIDKGNDNWKVMNDLDDAFSHIGHLDFLVDELQRAVDKNNRSSIIDITAALTAYMPVYTAQYDRAQKLAWDQVVGEPDLSYDPVPRRPAPKPPGLRRVPQACNTDQRPLAPSIKKVSDIEGSEDLDLWLGEDWQ